MNVSSALNSSLYYLQCAPMKCLFLNYPRNLHYNKQKLIQIEIVPVRKNFFLFTLFFIYFLPAW